MRFVLSLGVIVGLSVLACSPPAVANGYNCTDYTDRVARLTFTNLSSNGIHLAGVWFV